MVDRDEYPDHHYWLSNDPNFPYPIPNDIQVVPSSDPETVAYVTATVIFPNAIPFEKTIAERSAGIAHSWRFTIAIVANRIGGRVNSELVCTAQHAHFFPHHNETAVGAEQKFRVNPANLVVNQTDSIIQDSAHGPTHFDRVSFTSKLWANGDFTVDMLGVHRSWGNIGVPDIPRVAPPGSSTPPPREETPGERPPRRSEPEPHASTKKLRRKTKA